MDALKRAEESQKGICRTSEQITCCRNNSYMVKNSTTDKQICINANQPALNQTQANIGLNFYNPQPTPLRYKPAPGRHVRFASSPPEYGRHHWATPETALPFPNIQKRLLSIEINVISGTGDAGNNR